MSFKIYLLGQFKLLAHDLPIELPSRPAQSLLAYLVLNAGVSHRREKLATLLWPEATESNARSYLRQALWRLRKSLESSSLDWENYLKISDISVTFDESAEYWLDAGFLLNTVDVRPVEELIAGIRLYQGELLPGFYDEWVIVERDSLQAAYHQQMGRLLECLLQSGQWDEALIYGEQWIRLGYSPEPAFRGLMRGYAGLGDQGMVNATYQRCVVALDRELGLEPSPETKQLREQLISQEKPGIGLPPVDYPKSVDQQPAFLDDFETPQPEKPIFVARENELRRMDEYLDLAFSGQGRVIFITGEAGSGKTALIDEFTSSAQSAHPDLIVSSGNCNAHTGIGDPYLPFREVLNQLTGDVEAHYIAGAITRDHARILWNFLPHAVQTLVENGPDLIETFVAGSAFFARAKDCAQLPEEWLTRLSDLVTPKELGMIVPSPQQSDLFEQYSKVLQAMSKKYPLVLVVDDLQWADLGSISLLFHLGRQLAGSRILIVGAFRPEEIALGRENARHDSEPNQLGKPFRDMLYRQTNGHPLFTIELLRGMQERGDLIWDLSGKWVEGSALDWDTIPARVEAVVAERIGRLEPALRDALRVACVEGETFTAEVLTRVIGIEPQEILGRFSEELDKRHHLVRAQSIQRLQGQLVSRYRFRHIISQKYLYNSLDPVERVHLHEQVGYILEELYSAQGDKGTIAIAPQLARHYQEARIEHKAIHYLHLAGKKAVQLSALKEATTHLNNALELLTSLPDSPDRDRQELALQLTLGKAWVGSSSAKLESKYAYTRARYLCQKTGETTQLCQILIGLSIYYYVRAEHQRSLELAEEALEIAWQADDTLLTWLGHWSLGFNSFVLGDFSIARTHLSQITSAYRPQQHHQTLVSMQVSDPGLSALAYEACCLWCLGYPDQALETSQKALTLARGLDHPFSLADVICFAGCMVNAMRREVAELNKYAQEMITLSIELNYRGWLAQANSYYGSALVSLGQIQEGIAKINAGITDNLDIGTMLDHSMHHCFLAEAYAQSGQPGEGLKTLEAAFDSIEQTDEHHWEVEVHRIQGELLLMQGDESQAENSFQKAIEIARRQSAKSWELRATMSLARLWHKRGRTADARQELEEIYNWFTEGFDTPDLKDAKSLLEKLSNNL
jgi:predicted ATPase/DNA-binding SARP family transcriptional activator